MATSRFRRLMRLTHYWTSLAVLLTGGLVAATGLMLLLKKDIDWLQPPMASASSTSAPQARVDALFNAASGAAPAPLNWDNIDRIDVRPSDGIAKVITEEAVEYQVDLHTLEVLSTGYRGADIVEKIHDGTFFAKIAKYVLMFPSGVALLILWITGVYMFFVTHFQKRRKSKGK